MNEITPTNAGDHPLSTSAPETSHDSLDVVLLYFRTLGWLPIPAHYPVAEQDGTVRCSCKKGAECKNIGKHPINQWRANQQQRPTEAELVRQFRRHPRANVALVQGAISKTIVLDFDGSIGLETLRRRQAELGPLPDAPTIETPGGGLHIFFQHPGVEVPTRSKLDDGFDLRGDGGVNIAPPSAHRNGGFYQWRSGHDPIDVTPPALPQAWLDYILSPVPSPQPLTSRAPGPLSPSTSNVRTDGREQYMRDTIFAVLNDLSSQRGRLPEVDELFGAAWPQYEKHVDLSRPGRGEDEFREKCRYAVERARRGELAVGRLVDPRAREVTAAQSVLLPVLTTQEAVALPPPEWLIEGLLVCETLAVLYAPPASLKSFFALGIGLSIAHGVEWAGVKPTTAGVAYVAAEGGAGLGSRIQAWERHHGVAGAKNLFRLITEPVNLREVDRVDLLIATLRAEEAKGSFKFGLIIFDTLARSMVGGDENSALEMGQVIDAADRMRRAFRSTVMLIHHTGKDRSRGMRGSNRLLGDVDTSLEIERADSGTSFTVHVRKQKDAEDGQSYSFVAQAVDLPLRPGRGVERGLVVVPNPDTPQNRVAEQHNATRRSIAESMTPGETLTVSGLITRLGLGRGVGSYDRITAALPEGQSFSVVTPTGVSVLRRDPDPKGRSKAGLVSSALATEEA